MINQSLKFNEAESFISKYITRITFIKKRVMDSLFLLSSHLKE